MIILGLTASTENQVLEFSTQSIGCLFRHFGWTVQTINLSSKDSAQCLQNSLRSKEIAFCFSLQGVGSRLTTKDGESVWTRYQTPFLSLHHDNPSCNIYNHFSNSPYVANLYLFKSLLDIQQRYIKSSQVNEWLPYEISDMPYEKKCSFAERPLNLAFIKTGRAPKIYADRINEIAAPMRDAVWGAIDKAWRNENLVICDLLAEAFASCGHDYKQFWAEFWGFADLIENYLRSKRAAELVDWLKFQDGAIIIGDGWDFIDKIGVKALFKPSISAHEASQLYRQAKFIFNTTPYGNDIIHERTTLGLCNHSFVISDTNAWWDEHFTDVPSLFRFRWHKDLGEQLSDVIHDKSAGEKAESGIGAQRVKEKLFGNSQVKKIIAAAEQVHAFAEQKRQAS